MPRDFIRMSEMSMARTQGEGGMRVKNENCEENQQVN